MSQAARQSISFELPDAAAEWAGAALSDYFPDGLLLHPSSGGVTRLRGWLPAGRSRLAPEALRRLVSMGALKPRLLRGPSASARKAAPYGRFPPRRIGPFLVLAASAPGAPLRPASGGARSRHSWPIVLTQGQAFGSGRHESTRLVLESLAARPPGGEVLDVGAGSGILGFACLALGASRVTSIELESAACAELRLNRALNRVPPARLPVWCGRFPLARLRARRYGLVLANLVTPILLDLMPHLARSLALDRSALLCGGIHTAPEARAVVSAALKRGLRLAARTELRGWHVLRFERA